PWSAENCVGRQNPVGWRITGPTAGDRGDITSRIDLAHAIVRSVGDENATCSVSGRAVRVVQRGGRRSYSRGLVSTARDTSAGNRVNRAVRGAYLTNSLVIGIGDVEIARIVHRHTPRIEENRVCGRSCVALENAAVERPDGSVNR